VEFERLSIVPKLDLISAEFICHDILSFTESWLTPRVSDNDMIIPGNKPIRWNMKGFVKIFFGFKPKLKPNTLYVTHM
jgi:hypothetical protein